MRTASLNTVSYGPDQVAVLTDTLLASNRKCDEWTVSADGCLETPRFLRAGTHHFVPYIELRFPKSAICSITVGPGAYQNRDVEALKLFLSPSGKGPVHYFDEITATDIPYIP